MGSAEGRWPRVSIYPPETPGCGVFMTLFGEVLSHYAGLNDLPIHLQLRGKGFKHEHKAPGLWCSWGPTTSHRNPVSHRLHSCNSLTQSSEQRWVWSQNASSGGPGTHPCAHAHLSPLVLRFWAQTHKGMLPIFMETAGTHIRPMDRFLHESALLLPRG